MCEITATIDLAFTSAALRYFDGKASCERISKTPFHARVDDQFELLSSWVLFVGAPPNLENVSHDRAAFGVISAASFLRIFQRCRCRSRRTSKSWSRAASSCSSM